MTKEQQIKKFLDSLDVSLKAITSYEDRYYITTTGSIIIIKGKKAPCFMKIYYRKDGYGQVTFFDKSIHYIHRLVAQSFIDNPLSLPQVNHKNGNKKDNRVLNLAWCTSSENNIHMYQVLGYSGSLKNKKGASHPSSHSVVLLENNIFINKWNSQIEASLETGIKRPYISKACSNKKGIDNKQFYYLEDYLTWLLA